MADSISQSLRPQPRKKTSGILPSDNLRVSVLICDGLSWFTSSSPPVSLKSSLAKIVVPTVAPLRLASRRLAPERLHKRRSVPRRSVPVR